MESQILSFQNATTMMSIVIQVQVQNGGIVWESKSLGIGGKATCNLSSISSMASHEKSQLTIIVQPSQTAGKEYTFWDRGYLTYVKNNHESDFMVKGMALNGAWDLQVTKE